MQNQITKQVVAALKKANNVMVTVKRDPSIDELSAAIGLTLILNHMKKHATTVFSGVVPGSISFLQPETAIENNTDSLRDFIIALDKSKADKLRYKVEDDVVRIYITPYKTFISEDDLDFSQGEFNVDVVVALGVVDKNDFDQAVLAHGSILHDATIIGVTKEGSVSQIGSINWNDPQASSISEMVGSIGDQLGDKVFDGQIATAFMTGIIAETDRFRNDNTTPQVLSLSAKLLAHGANQKLIAEELESAMAVPVASTPPPMDIAEESTPVQEADGMMEIDHGAVEKIDSIDVDDSGELNDFKTNSNEKQTPPKQEEFNEPRPLDDSARQSPAVYGEPQKTGSTESLPQVPVDQEPLSPSPAEPQSNEQLNSQELPAAQTSLDHSGHKVIKPIHDKKVFSRSGEDLVKAAESTPGVGQTTPPPVPPVVGNQQAAVPVMPPVAPAMPPAPDTAPQRQTLVDLERQVNSPHQNVPVNQGPPTELPPPPAPKLAASPLVAPSAAPIAAPQQAIAPVEAQQPTVPVVPLPPPPTPKPVTTVAPQVVQPSTAPSVPPPLMPPSGAPQFYEADGTKGDPLAGVKNAG